jgi:hypothetical protein
MSSKVERSDPQLWERVKRDLTRGDKGGKPNEWSARKAQLALQEYKRRGGGYRGRKPKETSLEQWTAEEWGTKFGRKSLESGERYLPKRAREALSDEEYRATSDKKRRDLARHTVFAPAEADRREDGKVSCRPGRGAARVKADLYEEARRRDLPGRSSMSKAELAQALKR